MKHRQKLKQNLSWTDCRCFCHIFFTIMKRIVTVLLIFLILDSCVVMRESKDIAIDEKLEFCYLTHQEQTFKIHGDSIENELYLNSYTAFEKFLISSNCLNGVDKKSYHDLIDKIEHGQLKINIEEKLGKDYTIFELYISTPSGYLTDLACYDFLTENLKLIQKRDFRYKIYRFLLQKEKAESILSYQDMRQLISLIPKYEFSKIIYRRILIKEIFMNLDNEITARKL